MKKEPDFNKYLDWWLVDNFGKTLEQTKTEGWTDDRDFFIKHRISQEAYDKWKERVVTDLNKVHKIPKKLIQRSWWQVELSIAPGVFPEEDPNLK
jgi:hypothetical protein